MQALHMTERKLTSKGMYRSQSECKDSKAGGAGRSMDWPVNDNLAAPRRSWICRKYT